MGCLHTQGRTRRDYWSGFSVFLQKRHCPRTELDEGGLMVSVEKFASDVFLRIYSGWTFFILLDCSSKSNYRTEEVMNPQRFVGFSIRDYKEQVGSSILYVFYGSIDVYIRFYFHSQS